MNAKPKQRVFTLRRRGLPPKPRPEAEIRKELEEMLKEMAQRWEAWKCR